jgi:hypothetical protein
MKPLFNETEAVGVGKKLLNKTFYLKEKNDLSSLEKHVFSMHIINISVCVCVCCL